ncbi:hypothetical protein [Streptomyces sp. I05A-00742]|uniref:hypothetical protein n=1 Tax=Streptomyces sp. I05A-00742 TaxID=2732853 RepID=UPI0014891C24|nr:hypothetical protein [Streptomyces sp. I05A-00742]
MWGRATGRRRKNRDDGEEAAKAAHRQAVLTEALRAADAAHVVRGEIFDRLNEARAALEGLLDRGDGLPALSIREAIETGRAVWDGHAATTAFYAEARSSYPDIDAGHASSRQLAGVVRSLEKYARESDKAVKSLEDLLENYQDLYRTLLTLGSTLAPIRARTHAALTAATRDLAWAPPATPGRYALEARLHALADHLHALDAGRVAVDNVHETPDLYRETEAAIAAIRDEVPRL